jgi:hypothetical protein
MVKVSERERNVADVVATNPSPDADDLAPIVHVEIVNPQPTANRSAAEVQAARHACRRSSSEDKIHISVNDDVTKIQAMFNEEHLGEFLCSQNLSIIC